jgi:hypothetical protein
MATGSWTELGVTTGPGGVRSLTTNLLVVDSVHPIAAGLPDTFAPATGQTQLQSVEEPYLVTGADPVAVRSGTTSAHVVYSVPRQGLRNDGTPAPNNRAVLGLTEATLAALSEDGRQLIHNALYWADDTESAEQVAAAAVVVADWRMNEPAGARVMQDSAGSNDGTIGGRVTTGVSFAGQVGYRFPGPAAAPDQARIVTVPDHPTLDPFNRDVVLTVRVRAAQHGEYNLMQKGLSGSPSQCKIEWDQGKPRCAFKGSTGSATVGTNKVLALNMLHTIQCTKQSGKITIRVNVGAPVTKAVTVGSMSSPAMVALGGKIECKPECDYFKGEMADAKIQYL